MRNTVLTGWNLLVRAFDFVRGNFVNTTRDDCSNTTFIGITGSYGKTTATTLLGNLLATAAPTLSRPGRNFGDAAAQTVKRTMPWRHRFCVQELGATGPGTLDVLLEDLRPSVGIITGISGDHRQAFGTLEATAAEKAKLVWRLPSEGLAVLNADDPHVTPMETECSCRVVKYGRAERTELRLVVASSNWPERLSLDVEYHGERFTIATKLVGIHWAVPIMAALLAALELGVSRDACLKHN